MKKLLLLHGALGTKGQFDELETALKDRFETHAINFTGHGTGKMPEGKFRIEVFAGDIDNWMKENKTATIDIFGYSMGGYAALYFSKANPGKVRRIFTLATKFDWQPETAAREVKMLDAAKIKERVPEFAKELSLRHGAENHEQVLERTAEMMIELGRNNALKDDDLACIESEVLISVGDRDKMVSIEESAAAYRKLKNGKFLVIPETPHPLEQADTGRLAMEIKNFFR